MFRNVLRLFLVLILVCSCLIGCSLKKAAPVVKTPEVFRVFTVEQTGGSVLVTALDKNMNRQIFVIPTETCDFYLSEEKPFNVTVGNPTLALQQYGKIEMSRDDYKQFLRDDIVVNLWATKSTDFGRLDDFILRGIKKMSPEQKYTVGFGQKYLLEITFEDLMTKKSVTNPKAWTYISEVAEEYSESVIFLPDKDETRYNSQLAVAFIHKSRIDKAFK